MVRCGVWFVSAIMLACLGSTPSAAEDTSPIVKDLARAKKRTVSKLTSLTTWAADKGVSGFRHRVFKVVLDLMPDNKRARGVLKYKRKRKTDPWVQDQGYAAPADWSKGTLLKAESKLKSILEGYRDAVLKAFDGAEGDPPPSYATALKGLVVLLPDDPVLEKRITAIYEAEGRVEVDGQWILPDSVIARRIRAELAQYRALQWRKQGENIELDTKILAKGWTMAWKNSRRRVYGTASKSTGRQSLLSSEIADRICGKILGPTTDRRGPAESILLMSRKEARALFDRKPGWKRARSLVDKVNGLFLPDGESVSWHPDPHYAIGVCVRNVVDSGIRKVVPRHQRGWITEGVGQRITWHVLSRHGASFASFEGTEEQRSANGGGRLPERPGQWLGQAAVVLKKDGARRLAAVMTMRLNAMTVADVLVAYGLAAFLMETRPREFIRFLTASASRHDVDAIIKETLGADSVGMLASHLQKWLAEN